MTSVGLGVADPLAVARTLSTKVRACLRNRSPVLGCSWWRTSRTEFVTSVGLGWCPPAGRFSLSLDRSADLLRKASLLLGGSKGSPARRGAKGGQGFSRGSGGAHWTRGKMGRALLSPVFTGRGLAVREGMWLTELN